MFRLWFSCIAQHFDEWRVGLTETQFRKTGAKQEDRKCNNWHFGITVACPQPCKHQTLMHNLWNVWTVSNLRCPRTNTHTSNSPLGHRGQSWTTQPRLFMTNIDPLSRVRRKNSAQTDNKNNCNYITIPARGNESLDMSQCGGYFCPQWGG